MALNTKTAVQELISYTVITDKQALVDLLKKNGVPIAAWPTDYEVTKAVLVANKKSRVFRSQLSRLLTKKMPKAGETFKNIVGNSQDFGFTGVDDFTYMPGFTGVDDFSDFTGWDEWNNVLGIGKKAKAKKAAKKAGVSSTTPIKKDSTGGVEKTTNTEVSTISGEKDKTKAGKAISGLWDFINTKVLTPENVNAGINAGLTKLNADTLSKQNAAEEQSLLLQKQQQEMREQTGVKSGMSTTTMVLIGVGAIALIGVVYFIARKK